MCGRYTIRRNALLHAISGLRVSSAFEEFHERVDPAGLFNIAPSQLCPVIRLDSDDKPVMGVARWGLIPSWTKGRPKLQPINAKCETAATSPMFREALQRRRCLVPADGFYEWQGSKPPRQPFFIHREGDAPFAFAGVWERWKPEDGEPLDTFTILTTEPNEFVRAIHNRMPVILEQADFDRWLDRNNKAADVADLLKPYAGALEAWPVSTSVNKPENDGPYLIERV